MRMKTAQILMECLLEQGVDTVFGYPGGTILNVYDEFELHGYNGLTGRTDMHCHGDDDLLGSGAQGRNLLVACQLFPVIGVHAAVKALLHRSTSQI